MRMQPAKDPRGSEDVGQAGLASRIGALWRMSPQWRLLAGTTSALASASLATFLLAPYGPEPPTWSTLAATQLDRVPPIAQPRLPQVEQSQSVGGEGARGGTSAAACLLSERQGPGGQGEVVGFLSLEQAASLLSRTQAKIGAEISPAYLHNLRAVIATIGAGGPTRAVALVPTGLSVKRGDRVTYTAGHRDASLPCNYIPNLIDGVVSPLPK